MKAIFIIFFYSISIGQILPTIPSNVFRLSVGADASNFKWDLGENFFSLHGIGRHYFDSNTHNDSIRFSSNFDLYHTGRVYIDSVDTVEEWLNQFNSKYNFSLPVFGAQNIDTSLTMSSNGLFSEVREKKTSGKRLRLDYGMSNEVTLSATIPILDSYIIKQLFSDYSINEIDGAQILIDYHENVKNEFNTFLNSNAYSNLRRGLRDTLQLIYNLYYTNNGDYSVNWIFHSQNDPINNQLVDPMFIPNGISQDTVSLIDLVNYFYPAQKSGKGINDITIGANILLKGNPSWAIDEPANALYGQIYLSVPFGKTISPFAKVGQKQFSEANIGSGVNRWTLGLYGSKEIESRSKSKVFRGRVFVQTQLHFSTVTTLNTPALFFSGGHSHPDSILSLVGNTYKYDMGTGLNLKVGGEFEVIKNRLKFLGEIAPKYNGQDNYSSKDRNWDAWMEKQSRSNNFMDLKCEFWLMNSISKYRFGPISFDLYAGYSTKLIANNTYLGWRTYAGITTFYQGW